MNAIAKCFVAGLAVSCSLGSSAAGACDPVDVANEVAVADAMRYDALLKRDFDRLSELLADDLIYTHSSALVDDKTSLLDALVSGRVAYLGTAVSDRSIRAYGCTAVITGRGDFKVALEGKPLDIQLRFTNVWVKAARGWQMVAWESTRIPPPK